MAWKNHETKCSSWIFGQLVTWLNSLHHRLCNSNYKFKTRPTRWAIVMQVTDTCHVRGDFELAMIQISNLCGYSRSTSLLFYRKDVWALLHNCVWDAPNYFWILNLVVWCKHHYLIIIHQVIYFGLWAFATSQQRSGSWTHRITCPGHNLKNVQAQNELELLYGTLEKCTWNLRILTHGHRAMPLMSNRRASKQSLGHYMWYQAPHGHKQNTEEMVRCDCKNGPQIGHFL